MQIDQWYHHIQDFKRDLYGLSFLIALDQWNRVPICFPGAHTLYSFIVRYTINLIQIVTSYPDSDRVLFRLNLPPFLAPILWNLNSKLLNWKQFLYLIEIAYFIFYVCVPFPIQGKRILIKVKDQTKICPSCSRGGGESIIFFFLPILTAPSKKKQNQ